MKIGQNELKSILRECVSELLFEAVQNKIDNFQKIANLMEFGTNDDFYFVQIIKRWKDNPDPQAKAQGLADGTYHGGAWYLKSYRVYSVQELMSLKPQIIQDCESSNARAYITINTRSTTETDNYIKIYRAKYTVNDPRYIKAPEIVAGEPKSGPAWKKVRLRLFLDIDCDKNTTINGLNVWNETHDMLNKYNIKVLDEYETPSGGLHIVLSNKNNRNLWAFKKEAEKFDGFRNKGRNALVHANEDGKLILYSNVKTAGY